MVKKVLTDDGSYTFYSEDAKQTYHSQSGAYEEAVKKYVEPCEISDGMSILDFCFGLGYNSLAALNSAQNLSIVGLENDRALFDECGDISFADEKLNEKYHILMSSLAKQESDSTIPINGSLLKMIIGDAKETIKALPSNSFDRIFFDPFSPSAQPDLWSEAVFRECFRVLKVGGMLATYSCASKIRQAMQNEGFHIRNGPSVGRRAPSTLGFKR